MTLNVLLSQRARVLEDPVSVLRIDLFEEVSVGGVKEQIQFAISVPIDET